MRVFAIDFETYWSDTYSVDSLDSEAYVRHSEFDPYLVSIVGDDFSFVGPPNEAPWDMVEGENWGWLPDTQVCFVSHNAKFDEAVFNEAKRRGLLKCSNPFVWHCTADLSCYLRAPRPLDKAAKELLGVTLSKGLRTWSKNKTPAMIKAAGKWEEMQTYALKDSETCFKIWKQYQGQWPEVERRISLENRHEGVSGIQIDVTAVEDGIHSLVRNIFEAGEKIPWDWPDDKTPLRYSKLREECRKEGIPCPASLAEDDEACQKWEEEYGGRDPWIAAVRDWR